jgi:hypothetical protein
MDEDAAFALGTVLAALSGILERKGICTTMEVAETIGGVAMMAADAGPEYEGRVRYLGVWAYMVKTAAESAGGANSH